MAKKDDNNPKHMSIENVPNLHVCKAMQVSKRSYDYMPVDNDDILITVSRGVEQLFVNSILIPDLASHVSKVC